MEINKVIAERILNPTAIDLGEFVINPYKGCYYACLYCYAQFSKVALKDKRSWGEYVDIRINAAELLMKELEIKKPDRVLLGSTTECFLPVCKKYSLMKDVLDILNEHGVYFSILTRSPLIADFKDKLSMGYCENIYFTVNNFDEQLKKVLEPKSPSFEDRIEAVRVLAEGKINVIPYFSPVLPGISKTESAFKSFKNIGKVNFEGLNFNLGNIDEIIRSIADIYPDISVMYERMKKEKDYYEEVWADEKKEITKNAIKYKMNQDIFIHGFSAYFENEYKNQGGRAN